MSWQFRGELSLAVDVVVTAIRGIYAEFAAPGAVWEAGNFLFCVSGGSLQSQSARLALALCEKRLCVLYKASGQLPQAEAR